MDTGPVGGRHDETDPAAPANTPACAACSIDAGLAVANTSAGAPAAACWANVLLAPRLSTTRVPGWAAS
jgi:hypothetical protein